MSTIQIKDKSFTTFLPEEKILKEVARVADEINHDLAGKKPLFLSVLNGSFVFMADLIRRITLDSEVSFVKMASYQGTESTGEVRQLIGLNSSIKGRTVVIVEDIVDTGRTMAQMLELLRQYEPAEIRVATLLVKPNKMEVDLKLDYVAMSIPDDFIVGYGLDYDELGRNYRDIYTLKK